MCLNWESSKVRSMGPLSLLGGGEGSSRVITHMVI